MTPMLELLKSLPPEASKMPRWTFNLLPSLTVSRALTDYADNPDFDPFIAGYRAGDGHGTKQFSFPHATSVHFEGTEAQYERVVEFARLWTEAHPEGIRAGLLNPEITEPVSIAIKAGYQTYTTDSAEETCWKDVNLEKEPFMAFHLALVDFIENELGLKVINGNRAGHRPHFTGGRFYKKAVDSGTVVFPPMKLPLDPDGKMDFEITAGPSDLSGEYHTPQYLLKAGNKVAFLYEGFLAAKARSLRG